MLEKIIKFSLNNKLFILLGTVLLIVGGLYTMQRMDVDVFPDLTAPTVVVMTDASGMSAEEVERMVTFHIETAMNGATDVRRVRSSSSQGYSFVWVEFDWGTDIFKARQIVSEKMVTLTEALPAGVMPVLAPQSSVMGEILFIGMQADSTSLMELRTLADWLVKPAILATGGASNVTVIGGDYKQYQILADPQKMNAYGVTIHELAQVGRTMSVNSMGGVLRDFGNEYDLRGIARTNDLEELGATFIKTVAGKPVVVSDVAEVIIGSAVKMGYASQNGKPAVILSVSKQPNINTLNVTRKIERNLAELQKSLPPDVRMDTKIFRQADFIEASVNNVGIALIEGAIFVVIILVIFLASLRTTVISVVVIPLSLLGTIIVLYLLGMNINTMTLGGMCIAVGTLVDEAIISVENVFKRLRQNHNKPKAERQSAFNVIFDASHEIRASILNATYIIIAAFAPLFFLSGMEGRMLKPLGVAFIVSSFMSTFVAMTVTPLMCKLMLTDEKYLTKNKKENRLSRKLMSVYGVTLGWALRNKKKVLYLTAAALAVSAVMFFRMGQSFLPEFNEGSLTISAVTKPGVSLDENNRLGNLIETELLAIPEVTSTARRTGRGELDEHSQSANSAEIDVNFTLSKRSREAFLADVRHTLGSVPGIAATVGQPLGHRIDHMLSGTRANIAIKLFGSDLSNLFMIGSQIQNSIGGIDGLVDVSVEQQTETPQLQIRANRNMLARYGITIEEFNDFIGLAFAGEKLGEIYEGQRSFDLIMRLNENYTGSIEQVKSALIDIESGRKIPLEDVAEIVSVGGPNSISRENVQRKIVVSANVAGRDLKSVVDDIQNNINQNITLPEGYRIEYGGQFESAANASRTLYIVSLIAICVIFMLLFSEFKDFTLSAITMLNLPLALIGGVLAIFFTSNIVSIPSIIGFITLFGIATRNGILLISRYQHMQESNFELGILNSELQKTKDNSELGILNSELKETKNSHETQNNSKFKIQNSKLEPHSSKLREIVTQGSLDRLNPILMTAISTAWALLPLALQGSKTGNEIQSPMAVVILGGLLSSTLLNIYIVPVVYELIQNRKVKYELIPEKETKYEKVNN
ncbi:MAG: CusA/CzcA family heavy metal efflux RND transporter [Chitinispirillales bacterium]|jgi:CzcA family heavy metal efflux pump|nr:CusA/CzcA family heavy metal efflux RND transporter [Chitinispirillales bacterium]